MTTRPGELHFGRAVRDRSFALIATPPYDDDGKTLARFDDVSGGLVHFQLERRSKTIGDFVHDLGGELIVSSRVWAVMQDLELGETSGLAGDLRDEQGSLLAPVVWVRFGRDERLLDLQSSSYSRSKTGAIFHRIEQFVVNPECRVREDLFLCSEVVTPVFSWRLLQRLLDLDVTGAQFWPVAGSRWPRL